MSTRPQKVNVTNVIGRTAQQAYQTLQAAGFQVQSQGLRNGFVLWYNPSGSTTRPARRLGAALSPCTPGY